MSEKLVVLLGEFVHLVCGSLSAKLVILWDAFLSAILVVLWGVSLSAKLVGIMDA